MGKIVSLGLQGNFHGPDTDMLHRVELPDGEKDKLPDRIGDFPNAGFIARKDLDPLVGSISYSQTAIFGRFGAELTHPLYRKLNSDCYQPAL